MNLLGVATMASAAAGLIHVAAAADHDGDQALLLLFVATAIAQIGWAALALVRGSRRVTLTGAALNGVFVAAWVASRTVSLPIVDALESRQPVGVQDLTAAATGAVAVAAALVAGLGHRMRLAPLPLLGTTVTGVAVLSLLVAGVTADHSHDGDHGQDLLAGVVADHSHDDEAPQRGTGEELASGPILSVADPRVTAEQRAAAERLIVATRAEMARFTDQASVEAAGYVSIGDGFTGHEHFVHWGYLRDDAILDPDRIESIVFEVHTDSTKEIASAMYILRPGQTMADVPEVAGELTSWHDHQDLCWDGHRVAGRLIDGTCQPGGVHLPTPPMLHVWMVEHPCGPFAGIDGHGGGCGHE